MELWWSCGGVGGGAVVSEVVGCSDGGAVVVVE